MKRSQAIEQIEQILRGYWSDYIVPEVADQILYALEKRGMLPPLSEEERAWNPTLNIKWDEE